MRRGKGNIPLQKAKRTVRKQRDTILKLKAEIYDLERLLNHAKRMLRGGI